MHKLDGYLKTTLLAVLTALSSSLWARDLGVIGVVYPIAEQDMVEMLQQRAAAKVESGEWDRLRQEMTTRAKAYVRRPAGVRLPRAREYRAVEITPSYVLDRDINDAEGQLLFAKGTRVNPLVVKPLSKDLCFADGDDEQQMQWLLRYCQDNPANKLIMVNGDHQAWTEKLGIRLYFDQRGQLVEKFSIENLPAVVRQSGDVLYMEEFPVE